MPAENAKANGADESVNAKKPGDNPSAASGAGRKSPEPSAPKGAGGKNVRIVGVSRDAGDDISAASGADKTTKGHGSPRVSTGKSRTCQRTLVQACCERVNLLSTQTPPH